MACLFLLYKLTVYGVAVFGTSLYRNTAVYVEEKAAQNPVYTFSLLTEHNVNNTL